MFRILVPAITAHSAVFLRQASNLLCSYTFLSRAKNQHSRRICKSNGALSCVDGSFYARVNLSDFDVCRLRSCVRPFDAVDITAGLDEVRTLGPNQTSELCQFKLA